MFVKAPLRIVFLLLLLLTPALLPAEPEAAPQSKPEKSNGVPRVEVGPAPAAAALARLSEYSPKRS